jgi:hypothetical protein
MRRIARPIGFLLAFVLLQLVLVESGYACVTPMGGATQRADMAGMSMPQSADRSSSAPREQPEHESPCRFPWAPNGCQTMAPCAPSALAVASAVVTAIAPARNAPARLVMLAPPALNSAPELPPPRA